MTYENYEGKAKELFEKAEKISSFEYPKSKQHKILIGIGYALLSIAQQINMIDNREQK